VRNAEPFADFETIAASPNPIYPGGWINFQNLPKGAYQVRLLDTNGREVSSERMTKGWIQIGLLPAGMYFYVLERERVRIGVGKLSIQ